MSISPAFRRLLALLVAIPLALTGTLVSASSAATLQPPEVPATGAYFGASASVRTGESFQDAIVRTESQLGRKLAIDHQFYKWDKVLPTAHQSWDIDGGRIPFVSWKPQRADGTPVYWTRINTGAEDTWITAQADRFRNFAHPLFLVFNHEPYDQSQSGWGTPADFTAAWRRIVDIFRARSVTNVSWVLVLTGYDFKVAGRPEAFYPGDAYVDWIAADPYNFFTRDGVWRELSEVTSAFYNWGSARGKPLMLAEWGCEEDAATPDRKAQWFNNARTWLKSKPNIKALVYYNNKQIYEWSIDTSASSLQSFTGMANDSFFTPMPGETPPPPPAPPTATITQPAVAATYDAATTVTFAGTGTNSSGEALPASAHAWKVDLHRDGTAETVTATDGVTSGSFSVPAQHDLSPGLFYRITLTVTDSNGLRHTVTRDVTPRLATLSLETDPSGLQLVLDGSAVTTPASRSVVSGSTHTLSAPASQDTQDETWLLNGWTDGAPSDRTVTVTAPGAAYRAAYRAAPPPPDGSGLSATYFDRSDLTAPVFTRIDPVVDFDWAKGAPSPSIGADTFSVRWTGSVQPEFTETYTFITQSDEGVRLWVDGKLVISDWTRHSLTERRGSIALTGGARHDLTLEYFEEKGRAAVELLWSSPSTPTAVIPQARLYPLSASGPALSDDFTAGLGQWSDVTNVSTDTTRARTSAEPPSVRAAPVSTPAHASRAFGAAAAVCATVDVMVSSVGSPSVTLFKLRSSTGTSIGRVNLSSNGTLGMRADIIGASFTSSGTMSFGAWHEVQLCGDVPGQSWELFLDGTRVGAWTTDNGASPFAIIQLGDNDPKNFTANFDNVLVTT